MAAAPRTPLQHFHDYLHSHVEIVRQVGSNKRIRCKKCKHNYSGNAGRIHDHLVGKPSGVKACTFSETNDKREVLEEIEALVHALPKSNKRKAAEGSNTQIVARTGLQQTLIGDSLHASGKLGVDQALSDWVFEAGIPFNVFR